MLDDEVNAGNGGLDARLHHIFGELFFVEDNHFFDVAHTALEVFAEGDDFADHDGRAGDGLEHAHLAALNALGDFDFALAGEQRDRAHLAQVHAHRVVGFFQRAGRQVQLNVFALFQLEVLVAAELGAVQQVDALGADGGNQIVQIVGRGAHLIRQHVVHVAVGEIALFLADIDQAVNIVVRICRQSPKCSYFLSSASRFRAVWRSRTQSVSVRAEKDSQKSRNRRRTADTNRGHAA